MINTLLIIISLIIIAISIRSIDNEKDKNKFDELLNYELEKEKFESIDNISEIEYTKEEQIKKLIIKGYKDEEICKDLNIGRGELLLIKKCYQL